MQVNRDTVAAALAVVAQAAIGICAKHGLLTTDDVTASMLAIAGVLAAFHVPNARAAAAIRQVDADQASPAVPAVPDPAPEPSDAGHGSVNFLAVVFGAAAVVLLILLLAGVLTVHG